MKEPFKISNEKIGIQIGRTVISLSLKPNENLLYGSNSIHETNHPTNLNKGSLKAISKANSENLEKKEKNSTKNKEKIKETDKLEPKNNKPDDDDIFDFYGKNQNMDEEMNPEENEK